MALKKDFRTFSIYPTYQELVHPEKGVLQANIINGPYESMEKYLETQFWLLREDLLLPLQKEVQQIKLRSFDAEECYDRVKFVRPRKDLESQREGTILRFDPNKKWFHEMSNFERSKLYKIGSLICFTCNSFKTLLFATVSCRDHKYLSKAQILVNFCENYEEDIFSNDYIMIESEAFFEPYLHVLTALQNISYSFPFQEYLVKVEKEDFLPQYLKQNGYPALISVNGVHKDYKFDVLNFNTWPSAVELGLNDSQFLALKAALTREMAVIHGPPGTGKTFLALKIIEILTRNKLVMNRNTPILVISYTNCALDHILVEVLKITKNVVRIGGRSRREELEAYNFKKFRGSRYQRFQRLAQQDVIGLTTTGASRMRSDLYELGCQVVIVEEAAAVFEAHVIACLSDKCQHLIMIGDHKQLQPQVSDRNLEAFKLHISLFERMVLNRKDNFCYLNIQYRMAPEVVKLISPLFYEDLKNDISVYEKPALRILTKRVSFVTHDFPEGLDNDKAKSEGYQGRENEYEAEFVIALANYLIICGDYTPQDVAILTAYNDQVLAIKKLIFENEPGYVEGIAKVKVAAVDDFQGGESSIVILSLVRSNRNGEIGFLGVPNRITAALSKAKDGLVIIGNMDTLSMKCDMWTSIKESLEEQGALGHSLVLSCAKHPENQMALRQPHDFDRLCPNGDCSSRPPCMGLMDCGHQCKDIYRPGCDHSNYICQEPCLKYCKAGLHRCPLACNVKCSSQCKEMVVKTLSCRKHKKAVACSESGFLANFVCTAKIKKSFPGCNHSAWVVCGQQEHMPCLEPCRKMCKAGLHQCHLKCFEKCETNCQVKIDVHLSCGKHKKVTLCWQREFISTTCTADVVKEYPGCNHSAIVPCGRFWQACPSSCGRQMPCGHSCRLKCHFDTPYCHRLYTCKQMVRVKRSCGHSFDKTCNQDVEQMICEDCSKKSKCVIC